ncbi:DUF6496 domain-containing protein [Mesorhizobium metallidurans]|nr:DUF6496 domain-containing protein [Mesorhizobium metallidurans]
MPDRKTIEKARKEKREGKSPTTQAGEFTHEEIEKVRRSEHGARSTKQAIAIGLSEGRRTGVDLPPPTKGKVKESTREGAEYAYEVGQGERTPKRRPNVSRAVSQVPKHEPKNTASHEALSRQTKAAASLAEESRRRRKPPRRVRVKHNCVVARHDNSERRSPAEEIISRKAHWWSALSCRKYRGRLHSSSPPDEEIADTPAAGRTPDREDCFSVDELMNAGN